MHLACKDPFLGLNLCQVTEDLITVKCPPLIVTVNNFVDLVPLYVLLGTSCNGNTLDDALGPYSQTSFSVFVQGGFAEGFAGIDLSNNLTIVLYTLDDAFFDNKVRVRLVAFVNLNCTAFELLGYNGRGNRVFLGIGHICEEVDCILEVTIFLELLGGHLFINLFKGQPI